MFAIYTEVSIFLKLHPFQNIIIHNWRTLYIKTHVSHFQHLSAGSNYAQRSITPNNGNYSNLDPFFKNVQKSREVTSKIFWLGVGCIMQSKIENFDFKSQKLMSALKSWCPTSNTWPSASNFWLTAKHIFILQNLMPYLKFSNVAVINVSRSRQCQAVSSLSPPIHFLYFWLSTF